MYRRFDRRLNSNRYQYSGFGSGDRFTPPSEQVFVGTPTITGGESIAAPRYTATTPEVYAATTKVLCDLGFYIDAFGTCHRGVAPVCSAGYYIDSLGRCALIPMEVKPPVTCGTGYYLDAATGKCIPNPVDKETLKLNLNLPANLPVDNEQLNAQIKVLCDEGFYYNTTLNKCVRGTAPPAVDCLDGYFPDANKKCNTPTNVCKSYNKVLSADGLGCCDKLGMNIDSTGNCVAGSGSSGAVIAIAGAAALALLFLK